ncbi:hypothetical protein BpHYR1_044017 [Brachionus plicatilis]|uniref:Uncharacterized protein n=1 Tax=Brachionus plicatilis TaxID=10195 RepID=A0A3M7PZP6_BRAPC|nr:hypothetical protein BpHYR1_044017 [Brachionus plicatilis]
MTESFHSIGCQTGRRIRSEFQIKLYQIADSIVLNNAKTCSTLHYICINYMNSNMKIETHLNEKIQNDKIL